MTRLRKMMLEELQRRNYSGITTRNYLRRVVARTLLSILASPPTSLAPTNFEPIKPICCKTAS